MFGISLPIEWMLGIAFTVGVAWARNEYKHRIQDDNICLIMDKLNIPHKKRRFF